MRTFGVECEVADGAGAVLQLMAQRGLAGDSDFHDYHCTCSDCYHFRDGAPFAGQEDCTVDGELISKVLHYGTTEADAALMGLAQAMVDGRADQDRTAGFHVHVEAPRTPAARVLLYRLFLRYQDNLAELAAGKFGEVRDYNAPLEVYHLLRFDGPSEDQFWNHDPDEVGEAIQHPHKSSWLAYRPEHGTYEFRLWNATVSEFRMRLAVGVSVALCQAADDGVNVTEHDPRTLADVLADYLDDATFAALLRQSAYADKKG